MKMLTACGLSAVLMLALSACDEKAATTEIAAATLSTTEMQQSSVTAKPVGKVEKFVTSSMPDTFTIPHNTCAQGESLQTLKKE